MAFDIEGAKRAGYSDAEIQEFLKAKGIQQPEPSAGALPQAQQPAAPGKIPSVGAAPPTGEPTFLEDVGRSAVPEFVRGVTGLATLPRTASDLLGGALGLSDDPRAKFGSVPYPSYADAMGGIERALPFTMYKPQTPGGKVVGTALQMLPGAGFGPGGAAAKGLQWIGGAVGSEGLGQLAEGTAAEPWARVLGGVTGSTVLPKAARSVVTPNPYNQKMLADYKATRADVAGRTKMMETKQLQDTIAALRRGPNPIDVGKLQGQAFDMLTPAQQQAAIALGRKPAPTYVGPGKPPPPPPPEWTGAQYGALQDVLERTIPKASPVDRVGLLRLQKAYDDAMKKSTQGTPYEGAWSDLKKQRQGLDKEVDQRIRAAGGGPGKLMMGTLGALATGAAGHKMGLPPGALEALGMLAGVGGQRYTSKLLPSFKEAIPGMAAYRRNQMWQPGPATQFSPVRNAAMLSSGDLVLPPLLAEPPQ